jgi:hypothetical protein
MFSYFREVYAMLQVNRVGLIKCMGPLNLVGRHILLKGRVMRTPGLDTYVTMKKITPVVQPVARHIVSH